MNKLVFVLLAVCLVSVHAFVKREADTPSPNYFEDIQKQLQDVTKNINEMMKPEQLKKGFNDIVDNLNKAVTDLKAKINEGQKN